MYIKATVKYSPDILSTQVNSAELNRHMKSVLNNKYSLIALTMVGLVLGIAFDAIVVNSGGASGVSDAIFFTVALTLMFDIVMREGTKYSIVAVIFEHHGIADNNIEARIFRLGVYVMMITFALAIVLANVVNELNILNYKYELLEAFAIGIVASSLSGAAVFATITDSKGRYTPGAARNIIVNGISCVILLSIPKNTFNSLQQVLIAYAVSSIIYCLVVMSFSLKLIPNKSGGKIDAELLRNIKTKFTPAILNIGMGQGTQFVMRSAVIGMGDGALVIYYIGHRIYTSLQSVIGSTIATVSTKSYKNIIWNKENTNAILLKSAKTTVFLSLSVMLFVMLFGQSFINYIYGAGLGPANVVTTSHILTILSFGIIFQSFHIVVGSIWFFRGKPYMLTYINAAHSLLLIIAIISVSHLYTIVHMAILVVVSSFILVMTNTMLLLKSTDKTSSSISN